jgi:hypothetical protein
MYEKFLTVFVKEKASPSNNIEFVCSCIRGARWWLHTAETAVAEK